MLKNIVLFVKNIEASLAFYQDVLGLVPKVRQQGNVVLTGGLVLQDVDAWEMQGQESVPGGVMLYFEESNLERIIDAVKKRGIEVCEGGDVVNAAGKHFVRFYDLDGYLIEVATTWNY